MSKTIFYHRPRTIQVLPVLVVQEGQQQNHNEKLYRVNFLELTLIMSSSDNNNNANNNTIQIDQMSLDQLDQLKQREENRMQALTGRYAQLRQAAARLSASQMAIKELQESIQEAATNTNSTHCNVFVPLTESVYVPGKIKLYNNTNTTNNESKEESEKNSNHDDQLLVELGTGYFVEKSPDDTIEYLNRKIRLVDTNSNNITTAVQSTKHNLDQITMAMQGKLLEIRARQEGQRHRTAMEG